ncbi:MAG TPA: oligoendopeptidase F [Chloroflexota bacterium]|nr:oligoendopeptidase F [Chloroflexota bacterium]
MTTDTRPLPARSEIPVEYTWDLASVFPSEAAWAAEVDALTSALPKAEQFRGRLGTSPGILADWLELRDQWLARLGRVFVYGVMGAETDTADTAAAARRSRAIGLNARIAAAISFTEPELLEIGFHNLRSGLAEDPRLATYAHYIDALERAQAHVRSAEVEEVMGLVEDPFQTASGVHRILADAELPFAPARDSLGHEIEIAQGTIQALLASPDREVRRTAWERYADAHLAMKNTMATCLAAGVKQDVFRARVRRYPSSLDAAVSANNIPPEVFRNLITTFRANLPTWHRYWALRRRALDLDTFHVYDITAPLTKTQEPLPFNQAAEWILDGLAPLGPEYVETVRRGVLEERWVDIYPNKGKRAGAFSGGSPGTHPFILMSYHDDIFSLSTLAHELGHSMHSYNTWQTQPLAYADYSIFVAEVASNFNQALVRAHLLDANPDPEFQISVIEEAMSNFHRYFFIMPTLARFELELHERVERGEPLTAEGMIGLLDDLFREGYGSEVAEDRERIGITWAEFPAHLYYNFYVYQYATGISGAHALASDVLSREPGAVDRYLSFLKAGSSLFPLDALKLAGVDLTSPEPVERAFANLSDMVDRLEQLIKNRG